MRVPKIVALGVAAVMLCFTSRTMAQSAYPITGSPHDLNHVLGISVGGDSEVCLPCHVAHTLNNYGSVGGGTGIQNNLLWNHQTNMSKSYTMYTVVDPVSTSQSANPILDTTSRLCLSCHDGAIAVDSYGTNTGTTLIGTLTDHSGVLGGYQVAAGGTDLSADHPVGIGYPGYVVNNGVPTFTPDTMSSFNSPITNANFTSGGVAGGPGVKLYALPDGRVGVGCGSCHEPHSKQYWFMRMSNTGSALCLVCHAK